MRAPVKWADLSARERDALVAEKVMGWTQANRKDMGWGVGPVVWLTGQPEDTGSPTRQFFEPTTDIAAAWEVVEKMEERWATTIESDGRNLWDVAFWAGDLAHGAFNVPLGRIPEAICIAALRAVGVEVEA